MEIVLALLIGGAFGAVLDRIGASDPNVIGRMLNLTNLKLMKAILLAIGTGSALMFGGQMLGLVDVGHMSVKTAYLGVLFGGLLLGAGWALAGYCPGTGLVAAGAGRRDAFAFIAGGLLGAAAYMISYPAAKSLGILDPILGGKTTLGSVPGTDYAALTGLPGDILGIVLGVAFVVVAFLLPDWIVRRDTRLPAE
ncbi:YeeE/YedE thiosulfate transporter family protein [Roseibium sp. Sym1]|uniref:YeeE/YedE thiosulfate transporter family protein n=1 Tax=Roseibium sp. Sym1 TaxID=3016006 RepID=UPI0022B38DFC|nr:YeeE/YedE thiosulfate transporter family protein [Roseibium sp. Sym1]